MTRRDYYDNVFLRQQERIEKNFRLNESCCAVSSFISYPRIKETNSWQLTSSLKFSLSNVLFYYYFSVKEVSLEERKPMKFKAAYKR